MTLDLEGKASAAMIALLQTSQELQVCKFTPQADETPREDGQFVVNAKRGDEVAPPSGVWKVILTIDLRVKLRKGGLSLDAFLALTAAASAQMEQHWLLLAQNLTSMRNDWHCYDARLTDVDKTPEESAHHAQWTLELDAMPVTFAQAETLKPPIPAASF